MNISIFSMANKLVTGADSLQQLTDEVKRLGMKNPLIVTDKVLVDAGVVQRVEDLLSSAYGIFSDVNPEPEIEIVEHMCTVYQGRKT